MWTASRPRYARIERRMIGMADDYRVSPKPGLPPLSPHLTPSSYLDHTTKQVEQLKASIEDREWIPVGLQRLVCGTATLTTGAFLTWELFVCWRVCAIGASAWPERALLCQ